MKNSNVHIIHAGTMDNWGTQALLLSDISMIKRVLDENVIFSISASDINGVKNLNQNLDAIVPPMIDIPYQKADSLAKKFGFGRESLRYRVLALACLGFMVIQALASIFSAVLEKNNFKAFYRAESVKRLNNCDLVISCSGENFKEGASLLPFNLFWRISWWSMLIARTWEILVAKYFRKTVVMFPNSLGPFRTWIGKFLSRISLNNCLFVLIRDPISYDLVKSLGIKSNTILTADTALLYKSADQVTFYQDEWKNPVIGVNTGIYGFSVSDKEVRSYIIAHAQALDESIEKYGFKVFLLPHFVSGFKQDDMELCKQILGEMKNNDQVEIFVAKTVEEFKSFINNMDMIISSKMHPAIFAASGYVPTLSIAYDHKQIGFFQRLGMEEYVISIRMITGNALLFKISQVWNNRVSIRKTLMKKIPILQRNIEMAIRKSILNFRANT